MKGTFLADPSYRAQQRPYNFFLGGGGSKLRTPFTRVFRIQTGFRVRWFVFTQTQKVASETFEENKTH